MGLEGNGFLFLKKKTDGGTLEKCLTVTFLPQI